MTDARFPERWLNDRRIMRLSDPAFRLFVISLAWSVANKADGYLSPPDLIALAYSVPPYGPIDSCVDELAQAGLWVRGSDFSGDYWMIIEFEETQTTSADLAHLAEARRKARDKKRRQRANLTLVPGDVPGDSTRTGQARTGSTSVRPKVNSSSAAISQDRRDHDGSEPVVHDDQQNPDEVLADASLQTVTRASDGETEQQRRQRLARVHALWPKVTS